MDGVDLFGIGIRKFLVIVYDSTLYDLVPKTVSQIINLKKRGQFGYMSLYRSLRV